MKTIACVALLSMLAACGPDPDPVFKYTYSVSNTAAFAVVMSCLGCEAVTIASNSQTTLKTNTEFADYALSPAITTALKVTYDEADPNEITLRSYEFDVEYRVTGDATALDVTLKNASGDTEQYSGINPPTTYQFRDFTSGELYISAKKTGTPGTVLVQIFYKERVLVGDMTTVSKGVVTAQASL